MMTDRIVGTSGRLTIVIAAVVGVAVGACSGEPTASIPPEPMGADASPSDDMSPAQYAPDPMGRVSLPLDAYKDYATAAAGGMTAEAVECFVDVGVDAARVGVEVSQAEQNDRRYSVVDDKVASRYGYHSPEVDDPRDALLDAADEDQLVAVSACLADLPDPSPEVVAGEQLLSDIQADAWWAAQRDARVVEAFEAWSGCMAQAGYDYGHPMEANDDPTWSTPRATAAEITVAKTDVACKEEVDLVSTWSKVEAELQASLIAEHESELAEYSDALGR